MDHLPAALFRADQPAAPLRTDQLVAIVGSGAMGAGIAQVAAAAGYHVCLYDTRPEALDRALAGITSAYGKLVAKGRMTVQQACAASARLQTAGGLGDLAGAALVVEAVVEDLAVKQALFAELEAVVGDHCIVATNTSSISVTAIAARLRVPHRLVGMHFFNPVPQMALVEVVSGLATDASVAAVVHATAAAWGKSPVHARSTPGFIVNRVARPFYAEGLRLLNEGAADVATLDAVLRDAGGFRMGPFELMDLIGHDVNFSVTRSVFNAYFHDPRYTPSVIQQELVDAGFLGRKAGRGFYRYDADAPAVGSACVPPHAAPSAAVYRSLSGDGLAALAARLSANGVALTHTTLTPESAAMKSAGFHCGGAAIYLTDGRSATQRACDTGHADTVLFDLALDYATAPRMAVARADQCSASAYAAAVGLFQSAGFIVTQLDDVPGMAVMRTVAMLANEAADAVYQGVCSSDAVDVAMQKGVNYPRGPLAWADSIGLSRVVQVLQHLADQYGEDRYRVSPLLRRKLAAGSRLLDAAPGAIALHGEG